MKNRIAAAWRVLRGEWVAHAPVKPVQPWISTSGTGTTATNITWTAS